ncbi:MAG: hypothetical protein H7A40_04070 [Chlamydiales bacterium]|nr:hypothetical protein [Chlamydiales bacterium]
MVSVRLSSVQHNVLIQALEKRCHKLVKDLKSIHCDDQLDTGQFEELSVLERAYINLTGTTQLTTGGKNVTKFILDNQNQYGEE